MNLKYIYNIVQNNTTFSNFSFRNIDCLVFRNDDTDWIKTCNRWYRSTKY